MSLVSRPDDRGIRNEALLREVNVHIADLEERVNDSSELLPLFCECSQAGCMVPLEVDRATFEAVRENDLRFIVFPGHEQAELESVLERRSGFLIVEKRSGEGRA